MSTHQIKLDSFNQDCLDLFRDLSVDSLLRRILYIAATWTNSSYCICGLASSRRSYFSTRQLYGFTPAELRLLNAGQKDAVRSLSSDQLICANTRTECRKYRIFNIPDDPDSMAPIIQSLLFVPIFFNEERIGCITLINKIGAPGFTDEDKGLIRALASYSGIAINNAKLYSQSAIREIKLAKSNDDLALLNELGRIFANNDGNIVHMMDQMLDLIIGCLGLEVAEVFLNSDEKPDEFVLAIQKGYDSPNSLLGLNTVTSGEGVLGGCAEKNEICLLKPAQLNFLNRNENQHNRLTYLSIVPLPATSGVLGLLILGGRYAKGEEEPDSTFISSIAGWIAPLIENLRLIQQKQKVAILEERERIGMDLHDGVIQSIYGVGLMLENARLTAERNPAKTAESIHAATEALNATIRDIRSYIMNLKPDRLTHENIVQSMRRLANDFHANTLVLTDFAAKVEHVELLSDDQISVFYMICKEGLSNIAKHANAKKVSVNFTEMRDRFVLIVQDNGVGFDTGMERKSTSHGVTNMYTRVRSAGGDIDFISAIGHGTTVIAWLPILTQKEAS